MADKLPFDPYRSWLGIKDPARPLDHYQLLRLERFEDDLARVRKHFRKLAVHVRKQAEGERADLGESLLTELTRAMLCLTDVARKHEYDGSRGRKQSDKPKQRSFEQSLIAGGVVNREQLEVATKFAASTGFSLRDALVQKKLGTSEAIMEAYAESLGLPFLQLADLTIDESLLSKVPAVTARQHSLVPVMMDDNELLLVSPTPIDMLLEEDIRARQNVTIRMALCTPGDIHRLIETHYSREAAEEEMRNRDTRRDQPAGNDPKGGKVQPSGLWGKLKKWAAESNKK